jgi:trigger factor
MLEIKRENLGKSKVKLTVKVPSNIMRGFFATVYSKMASSVEVKGFRKGKGPKSLTISAIGENRLSQEIINTALTETYPQALKKENLLPVAPPQINIKMLKDLTNENAELEYEAEIDLLPEVKVGDYKKIKIQKSKIKIEASKEEIDQVIGHLQRQHATFEDKTGEAEMGDRIEMDFEGSERGVVLENLTSKNYPVILGSKVLIPEFEEKIIGTKKGEGKEFKVKIGPEKKEVNFKVKILNLQKVNLPALDDELSKKFGQQTIDDLEKAVGDDIKKQKEAQHKREEESEIVEQLLKITKLDVSESLVEQETHRMIDELNNRIGMMQMPFEQYLAQIKKTEADLHTEFKVQAEKTVKIGLILGEIAKLEKIDLKGDDAGKKVMEKLLEYAKQ